MAKKMENEITVAEPKEVGFTDLELSIKKPTLGKDGTLIVGGNFSELAEQISALVAKYKDTVLTEDNINYVKALKTQFQKLRTGVEAKRKDWKKLYIKTPEDILDAMCADLQKLIAEGENALGKQLDEYDQKRKDELTEVLKGYVAESVASHSLREEYACRIVLKKEYYNKTQKEEESADDIEAQAVELEKEQKSYDAGVELIKAECEGTLLLLDSYIAQLKYKSATEIVLQIKLDKKKAEELYKEAREKEEKGEKIPVGEPVKEEVRQAVEASSGTDTLYGDIRERTLWVRYKKEVAEDMLDFFTSHGIEFKFLK